MMYEKTLPNSLRSIRKSKKLSGNYIAAQLGITPQYYYDLETGRRRLNSDLLMGLVSTFNCTADEILKVPGQNLTNKYCQKVADKIIDVSPLIPEELKKEAGSDVAWGQLRKDAESNDISPEELRAMLEALKKIKKPGN
ncbi:helix-turn-helix domain-containing protein [Anaeroselena agilis]|uniref:Helix-turn-helix transcriptional regulator n=1 Tax=Anaeroselena agilis TaxID=3063788 RepID=A0ABU3NYJ9_9FIRM|nr:helix-turn-helix transcriptional regulator [Selenomonadales bacterium 4137-cl]